MLRREKEREYVTASRENPLNWEVSHFFLFSYIMETAIRKGTRLDYNPPKQKHLSGKKKEKRKSNQTTI